MFTCSIPAIEPSSAELTSEHRQIKININNKIRRVLARFARLNFLEEAFDSYCKQIEKSLKLLGEGWIKIFDGDVTIGCYMEKVAIFRKLEKRKIITCDKFKEDVYDGEYDDSDVEEDDSHVEEEMLYDALTIAREFTLAMRECETD